MLSYLESMAIQHNHSPIHDYNEIYQNVVNIIIQPSIYVDCRELESSFTAEKELSQWRW